MNTQKVLKSANHPKTLKNKKEGIHLENHNKLDEEIKPLSFINKAVNELNGLKGVYFEEGFEFKNVFSWNSSHVFRIYEADQYGVKLKDKDKPFLYAIAKYNPCCDCQRACGGCCCKGCNSSMELIITKNFDEETEQSPDVICYVEKQNFTTFYNFSSIYMNQNGKNTQVGQIYTNSFGFLISENKYTNDLRIGQNLCQKGIWCSCCCCKECREIEFDLADIDGNKGRFVMESTVCQWGFNNFFLGFPPNYNSDQNTMVLVCTIFLAFERSNKKRRNESDMLTVNNRRYF